MDRFVVLEHDWGGVHWDFMLERGDVLRTWAVDAPIVPGVELPARALADHRRLYLDYEGPISGDRGTVRRVEEGRYEALHWAPDRVVVRLSGVQLVGDVELRRFSSREGTLPLSCSWTLRLGNFD
jgi:hypothetical protein